MAAELSTATPTRHRCVIPASSAQIFQHFFTINEASQKKTKKAERRNTKSEGSKVSAANKCEDHNKNEAVAGSSKYLRKRNSIAYGEQDTPPAKFDKMEGLSESESSIDSRNLLQRHNLQLSSKDLLSLGDEQLLNDQIIDFWLAELYLKLSEEDRNRTHIFSTFFYKRLTNIFANKKKSRSWESNAKMSMMEKRHCRVKKWTKNVDLFSKDFIIIPVNEDSHWFLTIICFPGLDGIYYFDSTKAPYENKYFNLYLGSAETSIIISAKIGESTQTAMSNSVEEKEAEPEMDQRNVPVERLVKQPCILIFDSLRTPDNQHLQTYNILRQYLEMECLEKKNVHRDFNRLTLPGYQPKVPQQDNTWDCGMFLMSYADAFFKSPLTSYWLPMPHLGNWSDSMVFKRKEVYDSIVELIKTDAPENISFIPEIKFGEST